MPEPYDSVVSIGGQSFIDGVWRIFGPTLEGLTNPLPIAIPGLTNAQFRITDLIPVIPGTPQSGGGLNVTALVSIVAEVLLTITEKSGGVTIAGPPVLQLPGIPMPAVVPVAVNLTPTGPLAVPASIALALDGPSSATRFGLKFGVRDVKIGQLPSIDASVVDMVVASLQNAATQLATDLASGVSQTAIDRALIESLLSPVPTLVGGALEDALARLIGETGRLLFPAAQTGSSCDAELIATAADAQLVLGGSEDYILQVGFRRATSVDIATFPAFVPSGLGDCNLLVGNQFLIELICCVVERLPAFGIAGGPANPDTVDVRGSPHPICFNFFNVTANFTSIPVGSGKLSVCLDGDRYKKKGVSLVGEFDDTIAVDGFPDIGSVHVDFKVPLDFDVDGVASIANLRPMGKIEAHADVSVSRTFELVVIGLAILVAGTVGAVIGGSVGGIFGFIGGLLGGLLGGLAVGASVGVIAAVVIVLALEVGAIIVRYLLQRAVGMLLSGASLLPSPVALPPGLLDAFGKFASNIEVLDDLISEGVLHTPTSPWALLPRIGPRSRPVPPRPPTGGSKAAAARNKSSDRLSQKSAARRSSKRIRS